LLAAFSRLLTGEKISTGFGLVRPNSVKTAGNGKKQTAGMVMPGLRLNGFFQSEKRFNGKSALNQCLLSKYLITACLTEVLIVKIFLLKMN